MIRLPADILYECGKFGAERVLAYLAGENEASRAYAIDGTDADLRKQIDGRAAECAFALRLGLDPLAVLDWESKPDGGADLRLGRLGIDVKSTKPGGRYLLWPISKNGFYANKRFHVLVFMRGAGADWEAVGWISKQAFFARKSVATDEDKLRTGTWFMPAAELWPITDFDHERRLARLAIRAGTTDAHIRGVWP